MNITGRYGILLEEAALQEDQFKIKRDIAIILLSYLGITNIQISELNRENVRVADCSIKIRDKSTKFKHWQDIDKPIMEALSNWIDTDGDRPENHPVFIALDKANLGHRLTPRAINYLFQLLTKKWEYAQQLQGQSNG